MIFLIEYNRPTGTLVNLWEYTDAQRDESNAARLELELRLHREGVEHEVVTLEAESLAAIKKTHRRYFETLESLAKLPEDLGLGKAKR